MKIDHLLNEDDESAARALGIRRSDIPMLHNLLAGNIKFLDLPQPVRNAIYKIINGLPYDQSQNITPELSDKLGKLLDSPAQVNELTNELLRRYKTAAAADAGEAEKKAWDPSSSHKDSAKALGRSNKRFSGIIKATKKQFANDTKSRESTAEGMMGGINRSRPATDVSYEKVLDTQGEPSDDVYEQVMADYAQATDGPIEYHLVDGQTGKILGKYTPAQRGRARARRDKLDNEYGAYRYKVVPIYADTKVDENKNRKKWGQDQANFTDILNKQHQDKQVAQPAKKEVVTIPFHGWDIKYRPAEAGKPVQWVVIRKEKIYQKGEASTEQDAVAAAEDWIKKGAGQGTQINKNATIDFNSKFVSEFAPGGEPFYSTFVVINGEPHFVFSTEPHEGLQKSTIRAGVNFPSITIGPKIARPVGLQPHGRYIIDTSRKEELDDPGVYIFPCVYQNSSQDKTDRAHLSGPGFTVATNRGSEAVDEDCWKGYKQIGMKDKGGKQVPNCVPK